MSLSGSSYTIREKILYTGMLYVLRKTQIVIGKKSSNEQVIGNLQAGFKLLKDRVKLEKTCNFGIEAAGVEAVAVEAVAVEVAEGEKQGGEDLADSKETDIMLTTEDNLESTGSIFHGVIMDDVDDGRPSPFTSKVLMGHSPDTGKNCFYQVIAERDRARNAYYSVITKPAAPGTTISVLPPHLKSNTRMVLSEPPNQRNPIWDSVSRGHCILIQEIVQPKTDEEIEYATRQANKGINYIATGPVYIVSGSKYKFLNHNGELPGEVPECNGVLQRYRATREGVVRPPAIDLNTEPIEHWPSQYELYDTGYMISPYETGETTVIKAWKNIYQMNQRGVVYPDYKTLGGFWYQVLNIATLVAKTTLQSLVNRDNGGSSIQIMLPAPPVENATCYIQGEGPVVDSDGNLYFVIGPTTTPQHLVGACLHYMTPFCVKSAESLHIIKQGLLDYFGVLQSFLQEHYRNMSVDDKDTLSKDGNYYCLELVKGTISQSATRAFKDVKASIVTQLRDLQWFCTLDGLVEPRPAVDHCYGLHLTGCISMAAFPQIFTMLNQKNNISKSDRQMIYAGFDDWMQEIHDDTVGIGRPAKPEFWSEFPKTGHGEIPPQDVFTCVLGDRPWNPTFNSGTAAALKAEFELNFSETFIKGSAKAAAKIKKTKNAELNARTKSTTITLMRGGARALPEEMDGNRQHLSIEKLNSCWVDKVLLLVSMFPDLERDIMNSFNEQSLELLDKYVVRLTSKASQDFTVATASAVLSQANTELMSPLNENHDRDWISTIKGKNVDAIAAERELYAKPRGSQGESQGGAPHSKPKIDDLKANRAMDFRAHRLQTASSAREQMAQMRRHQSLPRLATQNVKIKVTGLDSRIGTFSSAVYGFGFCTYDDQSPVDISELFTVTEPALSTTMTNLDNLFQKILFRLRKVEESLATGSPKQSVTAGMVTHADVLEWCSNEWRNTGIETVGGHEVEVVYDYTQTRDFLTGPDWSLDPTIFTYCEEFIFFHLWKREGDPLFPRDQAMILSYTSDLRILCARFRNVHNNLMKLEYERRESGDQVDGRFVDGRNTIFRRWMVARCVLARLETATGSIVDLIDQRARISNEVEKAALEEQLLGEFEAEKAALQKQLATVTQDLDHAQTALETVTAQSNVARESLATVTQERDTVQTALDTAQTALDTVTQERDTALERIAALETSLTQARGDARNVRLRRDGGHQGGKKNNKKKTKRRRRKRKKTRRRR